MIARLLLFSKVCLSRGKLSNLQRFTVLYLLSVTFGITQIQVIWTTPSLFLHYLREVPSLMHTDRLLETTKQPAVAQLRYDRNETILFSITLPSAF